jgi:tRNA pseudouridine38-40 synthase
MNSAASLVCGEHDFAGFQAAGSAVSTSVRTIFVSEVTTSPLGDRDVELPLIPHQTGHLVRFTITGSGFLRHMVRNIVGTLVEIGRGRRAIEDVEMILQARSRALASPTAPPHGLILWSVEY